MPTWRMEGAVTVAASVAHNADREGTTVYLRAEKVVQPDGSWVWVPIGSGNGLRGLLRDISADMLWHLMGEPTLDPRVYQFLWSGGHLTKAGAKTLNSRQLAELRRLVPHVGLFGGSGGGRIIEGRLAVGKLVPIVAETVHIVPPGLLTGLERSIYEYAQIESFSRRDDTHRATSAPAIESADAADAAEPTQMRYGIQTLPAGLRMWWWMRLASVTDMEAAWFGAVLRQWVADGAVFGGRSATGHGRLVAESGWLPARPEITAAGGDLPEVGLVDHVTSHRQQILDMLTLAGS